MADITLTGADGVAHAARLGDVYFPYRGNWTSHLILADQPDPLPSGAVTLRWHGLTLSGYVLRSGESEGMVSVLVVGGAGGLWQTLPAKYYDHSISVQLPLGELLTAAGEVLSATSTAPTLSQQLAAWPRRGDEAGTCLDALAGVTGAIWRVLMDGSVFFGVDAFPASPAVVDTDYTLISEQPEWLQQELAPLTAAGVPLPGQRFTTDTGTGNVGRVHLEDDGERYIARVWYLDPSGGEDDLLVAGLRRLIREELGQLPYLAQVSGQVVQQRPNGTLDVLLDDRRLPPVTSVPYLVPVPGAALTVTGGARVLVGFTGGDPRYPVAQLYQSGAGNKAVVRVGDTSSISNSGALATWMHQVETAINSLAPGAITPLSTTFLTSPGIAAATGSPAFKLP